MATDELYHEIRLLVHIVAKTTMHALEQRLSMADASISGLQFAIMRALSVKQHTISELSQRFILDPSTLVPAVDALERKGLAKRGRDPKDRRRVPLSLTERGVELVSCVPIVGEDDPLAKSLEALSEEQRHQLLTLLRELVRHLPDGEEILHHVSSRVHTHPTHVPAGH